MADHESKIKWEQENVVSVLVKINRNQDPDLYESLKNADSKSGLARDLMRIGNDVKNGGTKNESL